MPLYTSLDLELAKKRVNRITDAKTTYTNITRYIGTPRRISSLYSSVDQIVMVEGEAKPLFIAGMDSMTDDVWVG